MSASTSAEPCTSALMMIGSSFMPPSAICCLQRLERQAAALGAERALLRLPWRKVAICRALAASASAWNASPGCGRPVRPSTSTGVDGRADLDRPAAIVDQRAHAPDDRAGDEGVADAQRAVLDEDRSPPDRGRDRASLRAPCPTRSASGWPCSSPMSVTSRIISSSGSRFCFFFADTGP